MALHLDGLLGDFPFDGEAEKASASVSADIARRSVRIRLNAWVEDPFQRHPT